MLSIYGTQIDLKEFSREEFHHYFQTYTSDPNVDPTPFQYNPKQVERGYRLMVQRHENYQVLGIFLKDGTPIGDISLRDFNHKQKSCTIGIALGTDEYKGHGYGQEAFGLGIHLAFCELHLWYLYGDTLSNNLRMQRIFDNYHFTKTETFKSFTKRQGIWLDRYTYVLENPILPLTKHSIP